MMNSGEQGHYKLKIAYVGFDPMLDCLKRLSADCDVKYVFTFPGDAYDSSGAILKFAKEQGIPCTVQRIQEEQIRMLEDLGVEYMIVAGYIWKIPVSEKIRQINIHPSFLPVGRGPWPMPVALLRRMDSGVTFHKLTEEIDEGDILLQERIPFDPEDHLESLMEKIRAAARKLLDEFLLCPEHYWKNAAAQETYAGDADLYWEEPAEEERTILDTDTPEVIDRKLRAFWGYGVRYRYQGLKLIVSEGYLDAEGRLVPVRFQPEFHSLNLSDRDRYTRLRRESPGLLSNYTFAMLCCWRKNLNIRLYQEDGLIVVRVGDDILFPLGSDERIRGFIDACLKLRLPLRFRYCDEKRRKWMEKNYPGQISAKLREEDRDYVIAVRDLQTLPGHKRSSRRNALHHFEHLDPAPSWEEITEENLLMAEELSRQMHGQDVLAEQEAIRHFFELGLKGILIRQGDRYIGFSIMSYNEDGMLQGHFLKCASRERGGYIYTIRSSAEAFGIPEGYINMEDDLGDEGLRYFKMSLGPEIIDAYEVTFCCYTEDQKHEER